MTRPSHSVLIIDDTAEDRIAYQRFLARSREADYLCHEAASVEQGLAMCRALNPDIVLIDYGLPDDDGLTLLDELVETYGPARFAILMVTGTGDEAIAVEAMKRGAHDYLVKGTLLEHRLMLAITNALSKVGLQKQIRQSRHDLENSNGQLQQALAAQQASAAQLHLALQAAHMATWELDLRTSQVQWSVGLEGIAGVFPDSYGGDFEHFFALVHPNDRAMVQGWIEQAARAGALEEIEFRLLRPDGATSWAAASGYSERDEHGAPERLSGIVMDITARKDAEADLRRRENEFKMLVENAPDIITRFDRELRHMYVSPTITKVTGLPQEAFIGKTNRELGMSDELCELWEQHINAIFASGQSSSLEFTFSAPDGLHYYEATLIPERTENGQVETVMSMARDLTAYKQAEARLRFLSDASTELAASLDYEETLQRVAMMLVEYFGDACTIDLVDDQREIRAVAVAHGNPETESLLREIRRLYPVLWQSEHPAARVLRTGQSTIVADIPPSMFAANIYDEKHLRMLRELGPASFLMTPLAVRGRPVGVISLYALEKPRRYTDDDLALIEELARRAALALDNAQLYSEAQEAVRERDAFLSIASHEVKNPLTSLLGRAQLLQRRLGRMSDSARALDDVEIIITQGRRINELLTDLLDVSRLNSGQFSIERTPLDLSALVQHVASAVQLTVPTHLIDVRDGSGPLIVAGDASRLEQVFHNLISNAVKYSPGGGAITIAMSVEDGRARIDVIDAGLGIPAEALPHLFKRFYRVTRDNAQQISGSGIGLYVVKEIVVGHGGTIHAHSAENVGSTFTVRLPLIA